MKVGEKIICPHCRENSIAREKRVMEGFSVKELILVCALCGGKLADIPSGGGKPQDNGSAAAADKLSALLGGATLSKSDALAPDEDYGRFCRNCRHFIAHPFRTLCGLNGKPADPSGECGSFTRNPKEQQ